MRGGFNLIILRPHLSLRGVGYGSVCSAAGACWPVACVSKHEFLGYNIGLA